MQKKVTITLAILMFLGFLFVLRSLIIGQINIVIGLPLLILPLIIANIYARVLLKGKNNAVDQIYSYQQDPKSIGIPEASPTLFAEEKTMAKTNLPARSEVAATLEPGQYLTAALSDRFQQFLTDTIDSDRYFVSRGVLLADILVFESGDNQELLDQARVDYLICRKANLIPELIINLYSDQDSLEYKLLLSELVAAAEMPLIALHKNQQYHIADLKELIALNITQ